MAHKTVDVHNPAASWGQPATAKCRGRDQGAIPASVSLPGPIPTKFGPNFRGLTCLGQLSHNLLSRRQSGHPKTIKKTPRPVRGRPRRPPITSIRFLSLLGLRPALSFRLGDAGLALSFFLFSHLSLPIHCERFRRLVTAKSLLTRQMIPSLFHSRPDSTFSYTYQDASSCFSTTHKPAISFLEYQPSRLGGYQPGRIAAPFTSDAANPPELCFRGSRATEEV